jgi:hypothetical protein
MLRSAAFQLVRSHGGADGLVLRLGCLIGKSDSGRRRHRMVRARVEKLRTARAPRSTSMELPRGPVVN